jgi:radical SAM superfamily enzyme YgiQ (UPF0313 family)
MKSNINTVIVRFRNVGLPIKTPPLGIAYLLKALSSSPNVNCKFIDAHLEELDLNSTVERIVEYRPKVIGFQTFSVDYPQLKQIAPILKSMLPDAAIVAGGPHVTALPEQTLKEVPEVDYIIRSEGEEAFPLLAEALLGKSDNFNNIPNLTYRTNGTVIHNQLSHVDVKHWKEPAWALLQPDKYPPIQHGTFHKGKKVVPIITSRGCPYPCTFCAGSLLTGKKIRTRDVNDVVDEIEFLINTYGFDEIIIEDENFTYYKDRVIDFTNEIKKRNINVHFSLPNGVRLDKIDDDIASHLHDINVYLVTFGIESANNSTLSRMKKKWNLEEVDDKIRLLQRYNITVTGSFILGFRDETEEDIMQTINYAIKSKLTQVYFGNYLPLPGTEDFNFLVARGDIDIETVKWENYNSYMGKYPYHPKDVSAELLCKMIQKGTMRFYLRPRIIIAFLQRAANITFIKSMFNRFLLIFKTSSK